MNQHQQTSKTNGWFELQQVESVEVLSPGEPPPPQPLPPPTRHRHIVTKEKPVSTIIEKSSFDIDSKVDADYNRFDESVFD